MRWGTATYRNGRERGEVLAEDVHQLPRPDLVGGGARDPEKPGLVVDHGKGLRRLRPVIPGDVRAEQTPPCKVGGIGLDTA